MRGDSAASRAETRVASSEERLTAALAVTPRLAAAKPFMTQRSINVSEARVAQAREVLHVTNTTRYKPAEPSTRRTDAVTREGTCEPNEAVSWSVPYGAAGSPACRREDGTDCRSQRSPARTWMSWTRLTGPIQRNLKAFQTKSRTSR